MEKQDTPSKVVIRGFGPHVRIKGTGTVKVITSNGISRVSLKDTTDVTFTDRQPAA